MLQNDNCDLFILHFDRCRGNSETKIYQNPTKLMKNPHFHRENCTIASIISNTSCIQYFYRYASVHTKSCECWSP